MGHVLLTGAIVAEAAATLNLRASEESSKPRYTVLVVVGYVAAVTVLSVPLFDERPVGRPRRRLRARDQRRRRPRVGRRAMTDAKQTDTANRPSTRYADAPPTSTTNRSSTMTIAVLPGTGKTGRRIAQRLRAAGVDVRAASRGSEPSFDWADEATWRVHLEDAEAAYVAYIPDIAVPGADQIVGRFATLAARAGLRRLVLLVGRGQRNSESAEAAARAAFPATTVLRASWFMQEFSEGSLRDMVLEGVVALPAGEVPEPFVDLDDVADVAVGALTTVSHAGRTYEITGPEALTFAEAAAIAGTAAGRSVRLERIGLEEFCEDARTNGASEETVDVFAHLFGELLDGRNAEPRSDIEAVLGRRPTDAATAMERAGRAGAWE